MQGYGLLTLVAGVSSVALVGANRNVTPFLVPVIVSGAGVFLGTWLTDIYGSFGLSRYASQNSYYDQFWLTAGYLHIDDVQFPHLINTYEIEAGAWLQKWRAEASYISSGSSMQAFSAGVDYRLLGEPGEFFHDVLTLDVGTEGHYYNYAADGFKTHTQDFRLTWRYPLINWLTSLQGSYLLLQSGIGMQLVGYPDLGMPLGEDKSTILLWKMGLGYDLIQKVSGLLY